jgi:hypothetical protein
VSEQQHEYLRTLAGSGRTLDLPGTAAKAASPLKMCLAPTLCETAPSLPATFRMQSPTHNLL